MSMVRVPTAPRAMLLPKSSSDSSTSMSPKQIFATVPKDFYPRLLLLEKLAPFKDLQVRRAPSGDEIVEARRGFQDSFAYLCDVQKGGATVTAAGLQKLEGSNILWLAANMGIRNNVKIYAKVILEKLQTVTLITKRDVEEDILRLAVQECRSRILTYNKDVQKYARKCRRQLRGELQNENVTLLRERLNMLSEPPSSMTLAGIVNDCYDMRGSGVADIKRWSKDASDDFGKLAHFIGRLGATKSSVLAVVQGMLKVPALRRISCVRFVEGPSISKVTVDPAAMRPYEIVREICRDPISQNPLQNSEALHTLVDLDLRSGIGDDHLGLQSRNTIDTVVHAELQVADRFSRDGFKFVDGDKYIGCSKPACYFCFNWLCNHKHGYVPPATHHKVIPRCRGPDYDLNNSGAAVLKEMYDKLCAQLGQDILDVLWNMQTGHTRSTHQYQSTEGSSYAQSKISSLLAR